VTLSHDAKFDIPALRSALGSETAYIGALGSRPTHRRRCRILAAEGFTPGDLARIHSPVGLDLGGRSPEEIAVAIIAEIVAVGHGRRGGQLVHGVVRSE
jgi:xanthine dehydrogenase accessory factor